MPIGFSVVIREENTHLAIFTKNIFIYSPINSNIFTASIPPYIITTCEAAYLKRRTSYYIHFGFIHIVKRHVGFAIFVSPYFTITYSQPKSKLSCFIFSSKFERYFFPFIISILSIRLIKLYTVTLSRSVRRKTSFSKYLKVSLVCHIK